MEYSLLATIYLCGLCVMVSHFTALISELDTGCTQSICQETTEVIRCPFSQILVTNLTSLTGETDDVMLRFVKRACMGKSTCDVSGLCKTRVENAMNVSFLCVQNSPDAKTCTGSAVALLEPHGFLQNPDYPAAGPFRACHWRIEPQTREAVHLTLFDLASVHRSQGRCDGGLHVSAHTCGLSRKSYTELLCAGHSRRGEEGSEGEDTVSIVSCGPVNIRLTPARHAYPLRFWLGYSVKDHERPQLLDKSLFDAGLLTKCPDSAVSVPRVGAKTIDTDLSSDMTPSNNQSVTSTSGRSDGGGTNEQDSTMTVLIVLVAVIGFISIVLSIILIVVCVRRRRPKVELIEHVYAVPGACQTLSHTYLSDGPPPEPLPRPRLVQAYSDVADARPADQPPQPTPASPAYAEVEEVCDIDADDKTRKRFQFRFRKRPSVSSVGGASSLYEDVSPLPANKNNSTAVKNNTLPKYSGCKVNSGQGPYSTSGGKRDRKGDTQVPKNSPKVRASPVYVHVVDSADSSSDTTPEGTSRSTRDKSPVAPLAAKFIANLDKSGENKMGSRGRTDASLTRLYPLQEGRVANLVSTLNRNKDTKNGVTSREENKVS